VNFHPRNILIDSLGFLKLSDFSSAVEFDFFYLSIHRS
jgi:hypothetical protein